MRGFVPRTPQFQIHLPPPTTTSQWKWDCHYNDVIMGAIASQITTLTIVYSTLYSNADQRKHQSSASLAFVRGIHRGPVNSPRKWPITRKMFPFDDVIMYTTELLTPHSGVWVLFCREETWKLVSVLGHETVHVFVPWTSQTHLLPPTVEASVLTIWAWPIRRSTEI